jgi:hypothetical protein
LRFSGDLGPLWDWAGLDWRGWRDKDGTDTEDEPDLEGRFVSLRHRSTGRGRQTLSHFSASLNGAILSNALKIS